MASVVARATERQSFGIDVFTGSHVSAETYVCLVTDVYGKENNLVTTLFISGSGRSCHGYSLSELRPVCSCSRFVTVGSSL